MNLAAYFALLRWRRWLRETAAAISSASSPLIHTPSCTVRSGSHSPTASFISNLIGTLFELLSLWFLAGFLENFHSATWVMGLYAVSVLGTALAAVAIYAVQRLARA